jgi:hypothetical protein
VLAVLDENPAREMDTTFAKITDVHSALIPKLELGTLLIAMGLEVAFDER